MSKNLLQQRQRHQQCIRASAISAGLFSKLYFSWFVTKPSRGFCQRRFDDAWPTPNTSLYTRIGLHRQPTCCNLGSNRPKSPPNGSKILKNAAWATFFGAATNGKSLVANVTDLCLLYDFRIFVEVPVKMNTLTAKNVPGWKNVDETTPISVMAGSGCTYSKLPRCFKCHRSTRISPIIEELEQYQQKQRQRQVEAMHHDQETVRSTARLKDWNAYDDEVEVFDTRTRITHVTTVKSISTPPCHPIISKPVLVTSLHKVVQPAQCNKLAAPIIKPIEPPRVEARKSLMKQRTPESTMSTSTYNNFNNKNSPVSVGVAEAAVSHNNNSNSSNNSSSSRLSLAALHHWLLRTFGRKSSAAADDAAAGTTTTKTKKTKAPRIRAAVHKTYFVRWIKPPETHWHGYGVRRPPLQDCVNKSTLRRCRSAVY